MTVNFDPSTPGNPYVRASQISINFPPPGGSSVSVDIHQRRAVTLVDGTAIEYEEMGDFQASIDLSTDLTLVQFPMINLQNDQQLGATGDLATLVELLVSYIRSLQRDASINN